MAAPYKAQALANDLAEVFGRFFTTVTVTPDTTTGFEGCPLVKIGSQAAGSQSACIRINGIALLGTDSLGATSQSFGPCVAQLVLETSSVANVPLLTGANFVSVMGVLAHSNIRTELYLCANGNTVGPEDITTGNLKTTFDANQKWKAQVSQ